MFEQIREGSAFMRQALQGYSVRQQALSLNLSNTDTPNYKRMDVGFEEQLRAKAKLTEPSPMTLTDVRHMPFAGPAAFSPAVSIDRSTTLRRDGNNIDIDQEMSKVSQNEIGYNAATQFLSGRFAMLKYVIADGGGS